jgi:hypothetical protein
MSQSSLISCPNCGHQFELENTLRNSIEQEYKNKYNQKWAQEVANVKQKEEELKRLELQMKQNTEQLELRVQDEVNKKVLAEKEGLLKMKQQQQEIIDAEIAKQKNSLMDDAKKKAESDIQQKLEMLSSELAEKSKSIQEAQKRELDLLKKQQELDEQKNNLELEAQRKMQELKSELEEKIRKNEGEKVDMKLKEKDKTIEDLHKMVDEMKRRSEQGSMQLQGEVQELALEELLRSSFPFDIIEEVSKGVRGADAIQIVNNHFGKQCGKIIYESKRTKSFSAEWIEKLKSDQRLSQADVAILVTQTMPKEMTHFGEKNGIWICSFEEVKPLAAVIRDGILKISQATASQENKGEKMQMMYDFLTSIEFKNQMEAIIDGFRSMREGIIKERIQAEKNWKEREKQLDKVLLNATHFIGSVKGIAGNALADIKMIGEEDSEN